MLPRLSHRHGLSATEIEDLIDALAFLAEVIEPPPPSSPQEDLRDPHDQPVLDTLMQAQKTGGADYLVTGDKDLLALADRFSNLTPAAFWAAHGGLS